MTDRFVTVPDSLEIPADVKVPSARLSDSTAAGRALLDAADAAAQRTALGLGTAATTPATDYATAAQGAKADAGDVAQITLTGNLALTIPEGHPAGQVYRCAITQTTGGHTVTYGGLPVTVDLAAGASTTVELYPVGAGYVLRYPVTNLDAQVSALAEDGGSALGASLSSTFATHEQVASAARSSDVAVAARARTRIPVPATPNVTSTSGDFTRVLWMSSDRATLYGARGNVLKTSTDDGATWATLHTLASGWIITGVRELDNGELLVAASKTGEKGRLWLSSASKTAWTMVLESSATTNAIAGAWGMSTSGTVAFVSEYGTKMPTAATAPRYAYLSRDSGATWTIAYDLGDHDGAHVHGCAYDPWDERLWVATGDTGYEGIHYSDDWGATWSTAEQGFPSGATNAVYKTVGILPMPDCVLFTSDGTPQGIARAWRTGPGAKPILDVAYSMAETTSLTIVGGLAYKHADGPALLAFYRTSGSGAGYFVGTWDGRDFFTLHTTGTYTAPNGPAALVGPTVGGKYVGHTVENSGTGATNIVTMTAPTWVETVGNGYDPGAIVTRCVPATVGGAISPATVGMGLVDLDVRFAGSHPTWLGQAGNWDCMVARNTDSDSRREWKFVLTPTGYLMLYWYPSYTTASAKTATSTAVPTTVRPGNKVAYLRVTLDADNGAGGSSVRFWESSDQGATWTQIGSTVTVAGTNPLPSGLNTRGISVGASHGAVANTRVWTGTITSAAVMTGIDATTYCAEIDFTSPQWRRGHPQGATYTDAAGNVWTLLSGATVKGIARQNTKSSLMVAPTITGVRSTDGVAIQTAILEALALQGIVVDATTA